MVGGLSLGILSTQDKNTPRKPSGDHHLSY